MIAYSKVPSINNQNNVATALPLGLKENESWWVVLAIDPLAIRLLPGLTRIRWMSANRLTAIALVVGIASVVATYNAHFSIGALLFELRFFVDCLDGKFARIRRTGSSFGGFFDRSCDLLCTVSAYGALGLAASLGHDGVRPYALSAAVMCALAAAAEFMLASAKSASAEAGGSSRLQASRWGRWCARHRLATRPWTVELETLSLFLVPLLIPRLCFFVVLSAACCYGLVVGHDLIRAGRVLKFRRTN
jgi:phosphatidylglycerophosphate synthase